MKLGLTLPSFVADPAVPLGVASAAEHAGLDGVFVYDHLFRRGRDGARRPALESTGLLGAVAGSTSRVSVGVLVARAWTRPVATLACSLETAQRISGGRVVAAIGAGDAESREENETFGLGFGTIEERVRRLRAAVVTARDRGFPVWVGGQAPSVRAVAAEEADGWNAWGTPVETFGREVEELRRAAKRDPFTCSWGGLVVVGVDDDAAREKAARLGAREDVLVGGPQRVADALRRYRDAGAGWVVVAPIDSSDAANATLLGEEVRSRVCA